MNLQSLKFKDSWDTVTIADYMAYLEILDSPNYSPVEKTLRIVAVLAGIPYKDLKAYHCTMAEFRDLDKRLDFLKKAPDASLKDYYTIGGRTYRFIGTISELTTGQFIDLQHFTKEKTGIIDNLHVICAIFLLPINRKNLLHRLIEKTGLKKFPETETYMQTPLGVTAENLYNNMLYQDANAISLFFCVAGQVFTEITRDYLQTAMKEKITSALKMLNEASPTDEKEAKINEQVKTRIISLVSGVGLTQ